MTEVICADVATPIAGSGSATAEWGSGNEQGGGGNTIDKVDGDESDAKGSGNFDLWED